MPLDKNVYTAIAAIELITFIIILAWFVRLEMKFAEIDTRINAIEYHILQPEE